MKVSFQDIAKGAAVPMVSEDGWARELGFEFSTWPCVNLSYGIIDDNTVTVDGHLQAVVMADCARCGVPFHYPVETNFTYIYRLGADLSLQEKERECNDEDVCTVFVDDPQFDVDEMLVEQMILAVPHRLLCRADCKGLCHKCGAALNDGQCQCVADDSNSPFSVLKTLKK